MYSTGFANLFLPIEFSSQISLKRIERKRSVLGGSALIVLHFSVIELEDCFESLLTGGDKKTAVGVW